MGKAQQDPTSTIGISRQRDDFGKLTARLVLEQLRQGNLAPAIVEALLLAAGLDT
jgi:hypothetical protein